MPHYPFGLFSAPMDQVARIHASSGTTGKPTVVGYTKTDIDHWATCVARSIEAAGGRPGDRGSGLLMGMGSSPADWVPITVQRNWVCTGHSHVGWSDREAGSAAERLSN